MINRRLERNLPAGGKQAYFLGKPVRIVRDWNECRIHGQKILSPEALLKLEWVIFYHTLGERSATDTALHFGITRKTFHKWYKRFKERNFAGLEELTTAPHKTRTRQISLSQRVRVRTIRNKYPLYGKMKLVHLYKKTYSQDISSWKIQKVIEEGNLYPNRSHALKRKRRQAYAQSHKRKRITALVKENKVNYLWHVDTVILTLREGGYRYLLTAIDELSKVAYSRLYTTHSSRNARDFLERLHYLTDSKVLNLHHDNGSEFKNEFEEACISMGISQWYSRPHTPKDNAVLERFNRTIQEEFVEVTETDTYDVGGFNEALLTWLIEYNTNRPHQTLDYKTPMEYLDMYYEKVSPMCSSSTHPCFI